MATPSTFRLELVWQIQTQDWAVNVLHYTTGAAGALTQDAVSPMAAAIGSAFTSSGYRAAVSSQMSLSRLRARDIRTDGNPIIEAAINLAGTDGGNPMPRQTCVVSTLRTTFVARKGRGRVFWPSTANNGVTAAGTLDPADQAVVNAFAGALMTLPAGPLGNVVLGVLSRVDNTTRTVTQITTDTTYDVQTRRRDISIV